MKKYTLTLTALVAVMGLAVMPSCKKDDDKSKSRAELMVGTWKSDQTGDDTNNNGVWDNNERQSFDSTESGTFMFRADGTGTLSATLLPISLPLKWNLQNSDNDLRVITTFGNESDTLIATIVTLSESSLVIKDGRETPATFMSFKK